MFPTWIIAAEAEDEQGASSSPSPNLNNWLHPKLCQQVKKIAGHPEQIGTEKDEDRIRRIFHEQLGFDVCVYENFKSEEFLKKLEELAGEDHSRTYCICVFLLNHGNDDAIICSDAKEIQLSKVYATFGRRNCEDLVEQPKLFFVQRSFAERSKSDKADRQRQLTQRQLTEFLVVNLKSSHLVRRLILQGVNPDIVEFAIRARLNRTGLVDVLDEQDLHRALGEVVSLPQNVRTREVPKAERGDLSKCIICKTGDRQIIFLPCSHLVSCTGCAASCTVCPSCERKVATTREVSLA
ncbi:uncharacterized protein LOC135371780 isoform X2 [Ornithodoros turicata]|uniref:uncharacterized protein LOC135371780 isoform X2 n=1 Tax=Ornithodoros turicata TaxID=34597 RepID=UPI003138619D